MSLGITLTFELLRYKTEYVNKVYVHSAMKEGDTYDKLRAICREAGIPVQQTDKIFHVLSQKENCYVIGEFRKFPGTLQKDASHIVLVNPSNAGNMGTIMRSALGFELNQMAIVRPAVDAFDPKVVRASMGERENPCGPGFVAGSVGRSPRFPLERMALLRHEKEPQLPLLVRRVGGVPRLRRRFR